MRLPDELKGPGVERHRFAPRAIVMNGMADLKLGPVQATDVSDDDGETSTTTDDFLRTTTTDKRLVFSFKVGAEGGATLRARCAAKRHDQTEETAFFGVSVTDATSLMQCTLKDAAGAEVGQIWSMGPAVAQQGGVRHGSVELRFAPQDRDRSGYEYAGLGTVFTQGDRGVAAVQWMGDPSVRWAPGLSPPGQVAVVAAVAAMERFRFFAQRW